MGAAASVDVAVAKADCQVIDQLGHLKAEQGLVSTVIGEDAGGGWLAACRAHIQQLGTP
jgi:hypothetical protein